MRFAILSVFALFFAGANASTAIDSLSSHELGEVIVTGSNDAVGRNLLPYTVSSVSASRLEATGQTQLLSAVSGLVPSLFVSERNILGFGVSNGGSGHIKMRGVGGERASAVLMMVDGQPQFAGLYSHHVADFYDTEYVERVEVLRGPASVLYGSNAMAGVINVITKRVKEDGVHTIFSTKYGSYNTWQSSITNNVRIGKFSSLVSAGYDRTDGVKKDFDFNRINVYAKVGYEVSRCWSVMGDYTFMTFKGNDPIYPSLQGKEGVYRQRVIRGEASLTAFNNYGRTNGAIRAYYSYGNHFIHDPNYFHSLDDRFGVIAYQNFVPWKGCNATLGFDFDRYSGRIPMSGGKDHEQNPMATMAREAIVEYSPYTTLSQSFHDGKFVINGGLRIAVSSMFDTQCVPQGGFVYKPIDRLYVKGSVAKGYRNPSFRELYLYKFANSELEPEQMVNYEISVAKQFGRYLNFELTGYFARGENLIEQTATKNENTGSFVNKGIELSVRSHPLSNVTLWATYSYLHTSIINLTGAPKNQYYLGVGWDATKKLHIDGQLKGIGGLFVASDIKRQNWTTVDMRVSYQVLNSLHLFADFDNLTATKRMINKGYPLPRFTAFVGFRLKI